MNVNKDTAPNTTILQPVGRLDFQAAAPLQQELESTVAAAATAGDAVLVDCSALDYVSSAGLRVFLVAARAAKTANVPFVVYSLSAPVREVFDISGFARIMDVMSDRSAALEKAGRSA